MIFFIEIEHGKKKFNFDKIFQVFQREINDKKRLMAKLKDKNGVLKHQKEKLIKTVRSYLQSKEVNANIYSINDLTPFLLTEIFSI